MELVLFCSTGRQGSEGRGGEWLCAAARWGYFRGGEAARRGGCRSGAPPPARSA